MYYKDFIEINELSNSFKLHYILKKKPLNNFF